MIRTCSIPIFFVVLTTVVAVSCSSTNARNGATDLPTIPGLSDESGGNSLGSVRLLWGYYLIEYDPIEETAEVIPVRGVANHWNVLTWLQDGPCTNCLAVPSITDSGHDTLLCDVCITHPFPNPNLTGFDVRGIVMFDGSYEYPVAELNASDRSAGDGEVINADGYTTLYWSGTEGSGPGGLEGYTRGRFATEQAPNGQLNAFKRYVSDDVDNTRNAFYAGDAVTVTYDIDMPEGGFVLGYAVDACWAPASSKPVTDPMTDFPPEANCPEPWKIVVTETPIGLGLTDHGGSVRLTVDVYDYQGRDSHKAPTIEIPDFGPIAPEIPWLEDGDGYSRYQNTIGSFGLDVGEHRCLITVEDNENDTAPEWLNLTAYQQHTLTVAEYQHNGWARTWGSSEYESGGQGVAADYYGNVYVVGSFQETVDFDPGDGVEERTSAGSRDAYLAKYDTNGELVWVRSWGGIAMDEGRAVTVDTSGFVFVTGSFKDTVDFDPGPDTFDLVSDGSSDGFMSKFDEDGDFAGAFRWGGSGSEYGTSITGDESMQYMYVAGATNGDLFLGRFYWDNGLIWSHSWGGLEHDQILGVAVDVPGNVYIAGGFCDQMDFDPGTGSDVHSCNGSSDAFLCKFDPDGEFQWAKTWGSTGLDSAEDVEARGFHTIIVVGRYDGTVEFNPDGGEEHTSNGWQDAFMSKFDEEGEFQWVKVWGGSGGYGEWEYAEGVSTDRYLNIYVSGRFGATVDFDPDDVGVTELTANGQVDAYIAKFNLFGTFEWVRGWGGPYEDVAVEVDVNAYDDVFVAGYYRDTVDFDPGAGEDEHTSNGDQDVFLSKFTPDGEW